MSTRRPRSRRQLLSDWFYIAKETLRISVPTVADAVLGRTSIERCDERLDFWSGRLVDGARAQVHVHGADAIDWSRAYIIMSNHQSHFDIPVLFRAVRGTMRMVTKKELFKIPVWGRAMQESGFIAIDRKNRKRAIASLKRAAAAILEGTHIWIAPEGTRSKSGALLPFKKGGFVLAKETGAAILPVCLDGTNRVASAKSYHITKDVDVDVFFGKPIEVEGKSVDQLMAETRAFFERQLALSTRPLL